MNPADLPLDRFCNLIWNWHHERMSEEDWAAWTTAITTPPPGAPAEPSSTPSVGNPLAYAAQMEEVTRA